MPKKTTIPVPVSAVVRTPIPGERLWEYRTRRGYRFAIVVARATRTPAATISRMENGIRGSRAVHERVCAFYGLTSEQLDALVDASRSG